MFPNELEVLWGIMRLGFNKFIECPKDLELPQVAAARIYEVNGYFGYLAWTEIYFHENLLEKGVHVLEELIKHFPHRPEAYFKLWQYYTGKKKFQLAFQVATECFMRVEQVEYEVITCLLLAKSNFNLEKYAQALDLLQEKHKEKPIFSVYLYKYGKLAIKSQKNIFLAAGIGAIREVLRTCDKKRLGKCYFWLGKAYFLFEQPAKSVKFFEFALEKKISLKKAEEGKKELKKKAKLIQNLTLATQWLSSEIEENWEKFNSFCEEIRVFDISKSEILISKGLCKLAKETEAIEYLLSVLPLSTQPEGYFSVLKSLFNKEDYRMALRVCKPMLKKVEKSPIQVWVKAQIMHAYCLFYNAKQVKAIALLKCLGKTFPFLPYMFTPYLQQLRKAKNMNDLAWASEKAADESIEYTESSFRMDRSLTSEYFLTLSERKRKNLDFCNTFFNEESMLTESNSSKSIRNLNVSEYFCKHRNSKEISLSFGSLNSEKIRNFMKKCEQNEFLPYSISSDPRFLYLIGKFAVISGIYIEDGLWALSDFIKITETLLSPSKSLVKALLAKAKLLIYIENPEFALEVLQEALALSRNLNLRTEIQILSLISSLNPM